MATSRRPTAASTLGWYPAIPSLPSSRIYWSTEADIIKSVSVPFADIADIAYHAALPVAISVFSGVISYGLLVRNSMIAVTGEDYILTARAKGLPPHVVLYRHTFRNALLPLITNVGMSMAGLMGGSVLMEKIFSWPGMGQLLLEACNTGHYLLSQAILLLFAVITVVCNFITDLAYHKFDPRVKEV